jgi:hypothetical protein
MTDGTVAARGILLRSYLVVLLWEAGRPRTVRQLADSLADQGVHVPGRPTKTISDALRWELRRGRVQRLGRGTYGVGQVPRTTLWRMRGRVAQRRNTAVVATGQAGGHERDAAQW